MTPKTSDPMSPSLVRLNECPWPCNALTSASSSHPNTQRSKISNRTETWIVLLDIFKGYFSSPSDISWLSLILFAMYTTNILSCNSIFCIAMGYILGRTRPDLSSTTMVNNIIEETTIDSEDEEERANFTRKYLKSSMNTSRESGLHPTQVPKHIAVIMDGNRRYGRLKYGSVTRGHWDGSKTLVDFSKWCLAEGIEIVTVYAFSTENWSRSAGEVSSLMNIFCKYCEELRTEALEKGIRLNVLSTETDKIPLDVSQNIAKMVDATKHCNNMTLNICLSYGSRGEILNACRSISESVSSGKINPCDITETLFKSKLLTQCPDPDLVIRTSGEFRLSNFLLWQLAYSEMFFLDKQWPEITKSDLLDVMRKYAHDRKRRFGQ